MKLHERFTIILIIVSFVIFILHGVINEIPWNEIPIERNTTPTNINQGQLENQDTKNYNPDRQWQHIPITYSFLEVNSTNGGKYICPDNEKERFRRATEQLTNETNKTISFLEIPENGEMKIQCKGREFLSSYYEEEGNVVYSQNTALITIRNANDPYRNCIDVELHEILHTFGYKDIYDLKQNNVMVSKGGRQCSNLPDLTRILEEYSQ